MHPTLAPNTYTVLCIDKPQSIFSALIPPVPGRGARVFCRKHHQCQRGGVPVSHFVKRRRRISAVRGVHILISANDNIVIISQCCGRNVLGSSLYKLSSEKPSKNDLSFSSGEILGFFNETKIETGVFKKTKISYRKNAAWNVCFFRCDFVGFSTNKYN